VSAAARARRSACRRECLLDVLDGVLDVA
jgi:hypothetical protein